MFVAPAARSKPCAAPRSCTRGPTSRPSHLGRAARREARGVAQPKRHGARDFERDGGANSARRALALARGAAGAHSPAVAAVQPKTKRRARSKATGVETPPEAGAPSPAVAAVVPHDTHVMSPIRLTSRRGRSPKCRIRSGRLRAARPWRSHRGLRRVQAGSAARCRSAGVAATRRGGSGGGEWGAEASEQSRASDRVMRTRDRSLRRSPSSRMRGSGRRDRMRWAGGCARGRR